MFRTADGVGQRAEDAAIAWEHSSKRHKDGNPKCSASKLDQETRTSRAAVRTLQSLEQQERHAVVSWMMLVKACFAVPLAYAKETRLCLASASVVDS